MSDQLRKADGRNGCLYSEVLSSNIPHFLKVLAFEKERARFGCFWVGAEEVGKGGRGQDWSSVGVGSDAVGGCTNSVDGYFFERCHFGKTAWKRVKE